MRLLIIVLFYSIFFKATSQDNNHIKYEGQIVDTKNGSGLPYVNLGIEGSVYGTSTNEHGFFVLRLPANYKTDTITISCVGYLTLRKPIPTIDSTHVIELEESIERLNEITISSERISPEDVVRNVVKNIPMNYSQEPYSQNKLYLINTFNSDNNPKTIEILREEYDDNGYQSKPLYPIRYIGYHQTIMGRVSINPNDVVEENFQNYQENFAVPTANSDIVDVRKNNFLSKSNLSKYEFEFEDSQIDTVVVIKFRNKRPSHRNSAALAPLHYYGTIWINESDFAIIKANTTTILNKNKVWKAEKYPTFESEDIWFDKEIVTYQKYGGQYYFSKLERISNWDQNKNGSTEIISLSIKEGKQEKKESNFRPKLKYDPSKWDELIEQEQSR